MSLKVLAKLYAHERMGNLVKFRNRLRIIEYTELPKEMAEETIESENYASGQAARLFTAST